MWDLSFKVDSLAPTQCSGFKAQGPQGSDKPSLLEKSHNFSPAVGQGL